MAEIKQPVGLYETNANTKYVMDRGGVELLLRMLTGVQPDGTIITSGIFKDIFLNSDLNSDVIEAIYSIKRYPFDVLKTEENPDNPGNYTGFVDGTTGSGDKLEIRNCMSLLQREKGDRLRWMRCKKRTVDIEHLIRLLLRKIHLLPLEKAKKKS